MDNARHKTFRLLALIALTLWTGSVQAVEVQRWVDLEVDDSGHIEDIRVVGERSSEMAAAIKGLLKHLELEPARINGAPATSTLSALVLADLDFQTLSLTLVDLAVIGARPVDPEPFQFPDDLRDEVGQGYVVVQYGVDRRGQIGEIKVLEASDDRLKQPVTTWLERNRFVPITAAGKAAGTVNVHRFELFQASGEGFD